MLTVVELHYISPKLEAERIPLHAMVIGANNEDPIIGVTTVMDPLGIDPHVIDPLIDDRSEETHEVPRGDQRVQPRMRCVQPLEQNDLQWGVISMHHHIEQ